MLKFIFVLALAGNPAQADMIWLPLQQLGTVPTSPVPGFPVNYGVGLHALEAVAVLLGLAEQVAHLPFE